jgi:hypothetical protein
MARPRKLSFLQCLSRAVAAYRGKQFIPPLSAFDESFPSASWGVNKIFTFNEVRAQYGQEPLKDGLGDQFYVPASSAPLADSPPAQHGQLSSRSSQPTATPATTRASPTPG